MKVEIVASGNVFLGEFKTWTMKTKIKDESNIVNECQEKIFKKMFGTKNCGFFKNYKIDSTSYDNKIVIDPSDYQIVKSDKHGGWNVLGRCTGIEINILKENN